MIRATAFACMFIACSTQAQTIVVNSNVQFTFGEIDLGIVSYNTEFRVSKYVSYGAACNFSNCFTTQGMQYDNGTLAGIFTSADEEADWYSVKPGDVFDASAIAGKSFPVLQETVPFKIDFGVANVGTDAFYLGVRTGTGYSILPGGAMPNRSVYGWVHLQPVNGTLIMLENVMSYDSTGIIIGTTTALPEPNTSILVLCVAATLLLRLRLPRNACTH